LQLARLITGPLRRQTGRMMRPIFANWPHHAEGLYKKTVTDFGYPRLPEHVESENIKFRIGHRSSAYQLFLKRDFYFIKCG
jgi:hypothetical protein